MSKTELPVGQDEKERRWQPQLDLRINVATVLTGLLLVGTLISVREHDVSRITVLEQRTNTEAQTLANDGKLLQHIEDTQQKMAQILSKISGIIVAQ